MPVKIGCPHCGAGVLVEAEQQGKVLACPTCRAAFQVPAGTVLARPPQARATPVQPCVVLQPQVVVIAMPKRAEPAFDFLAEIRAQAAERGRARRSRGALLFAVLAVAAVLLGLGAWGATQGQRETSGVPADAEVLATARQFVRNHLKAPRDAEFFGDVVSPPRTAKGELVWFVTGQVDAQNGFGVFLRGPYEVELHYSTADRKFHLHAMMLDGKLLYPAH